LLKIDCTNIISLILILQKVYVSWPVKISTNSREIITLMVRVKSMIELIF